MKTHVRKVIGMTTGVMNPRGMSYGYDKLRFIKPVFIGDTIKVRTTVKELREHKRAGLGMLVDMVEIMNQRDEVVIACEHLTVMERAPVEAVAT